MKELETKSFYCIFGNNDRLRVSCGNGDCIAFELLENKVIMSAVVLDRESAIGLLDFLTELIDEEGTT